MSQEQDVRRTPNDIERLALLDVLTHSILAIRSNCSEMPWKQIFHLTDAIHNIPIYLSFHEENLWKTVFWDLQNYDSLGYDLPYGGSLMKLYRESYARRDKETFPE